MIPRAVRRSIAVALWASLVLTGLESTIADVHDGDASATEVANAGPAPVACEAAQLAEHAAPHQGEGHDSHVCHAGHAHVIWMPALNVAPGAARLVAVVSDGRAQWMVDFHTPPDVPPPVV